MTTWHADRTLLSDYVSGATDYVLAASIETHLMGCPACRSLVATAVETPRVDAIFADVIDRIDAPRGGVIERVLGRLGVPPDTARLLVATPLMRASWLAAVLAVLAFAALAASADDRGVIVFLTLAPLAPVVGVATAYGPRCDPAHEISVAAPYSAFRLLMLRALAVMATTTAGAAAASLFVPGGAGVVWAWLLPALALTGLTVVASERVDAVVAAAVIAGAWMCAVLTLRTESLPLFGPIGQLVFLILALASAAEIFLNRHRANLLRGAL
jgi:Putative zinc-finger